jgi:hypothetical protein
MESPLTWLLLKPRTNSPLTCPYCFQAVGAGRSCPECETNYHPECAIELPECAVLGCAGRLGERRGKPRRALKKRTSFVHFAIGVPLVALIALIVIPSYWEPRKLTNETHAIGALKTITGAQFLFREGDGEEPLRYGTLAELSDLNLIDVVLGSGTKQGYLFEASYSSTTPEFVWWATARPALPGTTGDLFFATNQDGVIYESTAPIQVLPDGTLDLPAHAAGLGR